MSINANNLPVITTNNNNISKPVLAINNALPDYEGLGFPVYRAFSGINKAALDPFIHMDQMGQVDYEPGEPKGTDWHRT